MVSYRFTCLKKLIFLNLNYKITLNDGQYSSFSRADGTFTFYDIPPGKITPSSLSRKISCKSVNRLHPTGIYLLDVVQTLYMFGQFKIKVDADSNTIHAIEYKYPGAPKVASSVPIVITAILPVAYFQVKEG